MNSTETTSAGDLLALDCPRCGHHLGVMADDADRRGETHGKCGECGLDVEWRELRRAALAPPWLIEARHSPRNIVRRALGTLLRTARPFRFWGAINLALPLSSRGLAAFILAVLVTLHGLAVVQRLRLLDTLNWDPGVPASIRNAADLGRIALAVAGPLSEYDGATVVGYSSFGTRETESIRILAGALPTLLEAAVPFRDSGVFVTIQLASNQKRNYEVDAQAGELLTPTLQLTSLAFVPATLLSPLALLLLPTSLRRARTRPRHFVRLMGYTTVLLIPITAAIYIADGIARTNTMQRGELPFQIGPISVSGGLNPTFFVLVFVLFINSVWLAAAASRYLRLPNARGVGVACALIPLLAACAIALNA